MRPLKRLDATSRVDFRELGLAAVLVGSVLAVGSVHVPSAVVVAACSSILGWSVLRDGSLPRTARLPAGVALALAAYSAFQALPLPRVLVGVLSPHAADVWLQSLRPIESSPASWISLSLDPGASLLESAKWCGYAGVIAASAALARGRGQLTRLWLWLFISGVLCAAVALVHRALGADRLYGIYEPQMAVTPWRVAPLLNPNNLAGYLDFCAFIGFGLVFARRSRIPRPVVGLGIAFILAISIMTASRGAAVSLVFGVILLVGRLALERRTDHGPLHVRALRYAPLVAVAVGALALAMVGGSEQVLSALSQKDLEKLSVTRWALPMIWDYGLFGSGRGAFETVFPPYREGGGPELLYQFPENLVTQWLSEWGLVVGVAALAAFGWALRPKRLRLADDVRRHAGHIAILVLVVHNLVDLSLEVSSVATSAFAVLGALSGSADRHRESAAVRTLVPAGVSYGYLGGACVLVALAFVFGRQSAFSDRRDLHERFAASEPKDRVESQRLLDDVVAAIRRHPGDPYLPFLAGLLTSRLDGNAIPWMGLAIERDPQRGIPHYWLARLLFKRGRLEQALLHVRLAIARDTTLRDDVALPLLDNVDSLDQLMRAVPEGSAGQTFLVTLAGKAAAKPRDTITQDALLRAAIRRDPKAPRPRLLEGNILADALERPTEGGLCAGEKRAGCLSQLEKNVTLLMQQPEFPVPSAILKARHLILTGRAAQADDFLAGQCVEIQAPGTCWRKRVDAALATRDTARIEGAMAAYLNVSCTDNKDCAKAARTMGDLLAAQDDWFGALKYYGRAVHELPDRASWTRLSRAARKTNQPQRAHEAEFRAARTAAGEE